jgi:putative lipoprotein
LNTRCRLSLALTVATTIVAQVALADQPPGLSDAVRKYSHEGTAPHFEYALVDLNSDGVPDAVVRLTARDWCGSGGCTMLILRGRAQGFTFVAKATIAQKPIKVSPEVLHGWHTLLVPVRGGGAQPGFALMRFSGREYPRNPSVQPQASAAQVTAATTLDFHEGAAR